MIIPKYWNGINEHLYFLAFKLRRIYSSLIEVIIIPGNFIISIVGKFKGVDEDFR